MAEDRRTRRSRRVLGAALVELVLERGFTALTVEDITERADVARATFYAHFRDKEDLFARVTQDLLAELSERLAPAVADNAIGFTGKPVLEMLRHAREERDLYRIVLRGRATASRCRCSSTPARGPRPRSSAPAPNATPSGRASTPSCWPACGSESRSRCCAGGSSRTPRRCLAEEVVRMMLDLALHGRYWASGFEPPT